MTARCRRGYYGITSETRKDIHPIDVDETRNVTRDEAMAGAAVVWLVFPGTLRCANHIPNCGGCKMRYIGKARYTGKMRHTGTMEYTGRMKCTGQTTYELEICGLKRTLPVIQVAPDLWIASFVILGDTQLVNACAGALASRLSSYDFDVIVGPEAKAVPLLQALSTLLGHQRYVVCRKSVKAYMQNPVRVEVESITTKGTQALVLDGIDADRIKGKRVAVVDDVVSTGGSMVSVEALMNKAGATIACRAAILKEGSSYSGDLIYLQDLPVLTTEAR